MTHQETWLRFFELALEGYRQGYPEDERSDSEILFSMIESFFHAGIAGKNNSGQYTLPRIEDPEYLFRRLCSHRN